jgi:hypothetical protein
MLGLSISRDPKQRLPWVYVHVQRGSHFSWPKGFEPLKILAILQSPTDTCPCTSHSNTEKGSSL